MYPHDFVHVFGWLGLLLVWLIWALLVFGLGWKLGNQLRRDADRHEHGPHREENASEVPEATLRQRRADP